METKTLLAKYRLKRDTYVVCYLDVLTADDAQFVVHVGVRKRGDTKLPVGTQLVLLSDPLHKITARTTGTYDIFSITVLEVYEADGYDVHVCSPMHREQAAERRAATRVPLNFYTKCQETEQVFTVLNGSLGGFTLQFVSNQAIMRLMLNRMYHIRVPHKGQEYFLPIEPRHIEYNWRKYNHVVGVRFVELSGELETIVQLVIDPSYRVKLPSKQNINPGEAKITSDF